MRVVIAEDLALLREGMVALLREHGIDVVAQVQDGDGLLRAVAGHRPDLAIVDVRMPPTYTEEGLRAALEARRRQPELAVLILSQYVEPTYAAELIAESGARRRLPAEGARGRHPPFLDAVDRVAAGGTALDREVVGQLVRPAGAPGGPLDELSPREREVL